MKDVRTEVRCTDKEREAWVAAAGAAGVSLSDWIRTTLNAMCVVDGMVKAAEAKPAVAKKAAEKSRLCVRCARARRVGQPATADCEECRKEQA